MYDAATVARAEHCRGPRMIANDVEPTWFQNVREILGIHQIIVTPPAEESPKSLKPVRYSHDSVGIPRRGSVSPRPTNGENNLHSSPSGSDTI